MTTNPERPVLSRRRFLRISAGASVLMAAGLPTGVGAEAASLTHWRGVALGAAASISLRHPQAERIIASCRVEIERLENIFSLYRPQSALSRLNAGGILESPPFEMLALLDLCKSIHAATAGLFDPTVQPLWAAYAKAFANGIQPGDAEIEAALSHVGWAGIELDTSAIRFARKGMALTLNGIAQGYIADRVADLLKAEGLSNVLVNTGEFRALGGHPDGTPWTVRLDEGDGTLAGPVHLRNRALASSSPAGTVFDREGRVGHILNPLTGRPAESLWKLVSVTARTAALADGLTTAMCLMSREEINATLSRFAEVQLLNLS